MLAAVIGAVSALAGSLLTLLGMFYQQRVAQKIAERAAESQRIAAKQQASIAIRIEHLRAKREAYKYLQLWLEEVSQLSGEFFKLLLNPKRVDEQEFKHSFEKRWPETAMKLPQKVVESRLEWSSLVEQCVDDISRISHKALMDVRRMTGDPTRNQRCRKKISGALLAIRYALIPTIRKEIITELREIDESRDLSL